VESKREMNALVKSKIRVKIKSLAAEAVMIRFEERRTKDASDRGHLRHHRVSDVRSESRHALLAYAFMRGMPLKAVEAKSKVPADPRRVKRIVKSLGGRMWDTADEQRLEGWFDGSEVLAK